MSALMRVSPMLENRNIGKLVDGEAGLSHLERPSYGAQSVQTFDIPCAACQEVFSPSFFVTAQQKLPKSHGAFEDTEHGFDGALAQRVDGAPFRRAQLIEHASKGRSTWSWCFCAFQCRMPQ